MTTTQLTTSSPPTKKASNTVSYSRLTTFTECPAKYYFRYIGKPGGVYVPLEDYFLKGDLAHRCLEEYLTLIQQGEPQPNKDAILETMLPLWLADRCNFDISKEVNSSSQGSLDDLLVIDIPSLVYYAKGYGQLLHRCSASCITVDAIRNNDGSVPVDPVKYPPKQLTNAFRGSRLPDVKLAVDNNAALLNPEFRRFSLCDIAAQAAACFYNFITPSWIKEIDGIEYTSEKKIGWDNETKNWAWFVDLSYQTDENALVISDHKTSKEKPTGLDVAFHPQLNLYAYLWHEDKSKMPDYLSINHLPSGEFVIAQTDLAIVYANFKHFQELQKLINLATEHDCFPGKMPTDYNSPCIRRDWKTKAVTSACPYLQLCHPRYVDYVKAEVKDILHLDD